MRFRVEFTASADREFSKLEAQIRKRIRPKIDALEENPRPRGVVRLEGSTNRYRIRIGDFRVIYEVRDKVLLVLVLRVRDRKESYR